MLRFHPFVLVAVLASSLACTESDLDPMIEADMIEAEREPESGASPWWLRVVEDPQDLVFVDDFEINVVIDPATLAKDIAGAGEGLATLEVGGPYGEPLKVKLKIVVLPAGPPAE